VAISRGKNKQKGDQNLPTVRTMCPQLVTFCVYLGSNSPILNGLWERGSMERSVLHSTTVVKGDV